VSEELLLSVPNRCLNDGRGQAVKQNVEGGSLSMESIALPLEVQNQRWEGFSRKGKPGLAVFDVHDVAVS
jgi:hypothetical protein